MEKNTEIIRCVSRSYRTSSLIPPPKISIKCSSKSVLGSSNYHYFPAAFRLKLYQNNEIQGYSTTLNGGDFSKKPPKQLDIKEFRTDYTDRKSHNQQKLSSLARRNIRIVADHMQKQVTNKNYLKSHPKQKAFTSFVTLSFRRIIPTNEQAKEMLKNFNQRLTRKFPNHKYIWVAELQKGKYIKGKKSYRLQNKQEVVHFHYLTTSYLEKNELNTIWNEIVCNYFYNQKVITKFQAIQWSTENMKFNDYYTRIDRYKEGITSRQPKAPPKSEYLLMPNVVSVYNASAYMSKYMQKSGKLEGHLWGMSRNLQKFVKPIG